jgi:hypothetical protein
VPRTDLTEPLALELDHFLDCCRSGARPRTDAWNGVRVVATLEAAQQSLDKGGVQVEVDAAARYSHEETLDLLSDPATMRDIAEGREAAARGEGLDADAVRRRYQRG